MPLPILHTYAGLCAYQSTKKETRGLRTWASLGFFLLISNIPDLDFIPGLILGHAATFHRLFTHSIFAAVLFSLFITIFSRALQISFKKTFFVTFGLYMLHIILDILNGPKGVALFWPLSESMIGSPIAFFPAGGKFESASNLSEFFGVFLHPDCLYRLAVEFLIGSACFMIVYLVKKRHQLHMRPITIRGAYASIVVIVITIFVTLSYHA